MTASTAPPLAPNLASGAATVWATRQKRSEVCSIGFPVSSLMRYRFLRTVVALGEIWGSIREEGAAADFGFLAIVGDPLGGTGR